MVVSDRLKLLGALAQKYPSWVRAVCRAQYCYDDDEILELLREDTVTEMELHDLVKEYQFIRIHRYLLSRSKLSMMKKDLHNHDMTWSCQYSRSELLLRRRKCLCCSCTFINNYIREQVEGVKSDTRVLSRLNVPVEQAG